jgi:hypothetical protein
MLLARGMSREGELSQRAIAIAWQRDCRSCLDAAARRCVLRRSAGLPPIVHSASRTIVSIHARAGLRSLIAPR